MPTPSPNHQSAGKNALFAGFGAFGGCLIGTLVILLMLFVIAGLAAKWFIWHSGP